MDDKKFRKISKKELLEILLAQAKRIEELETELVKTKEELNSKKITIAESGTLAEASLKLNEIFEVAQKSIDQYRFNVEEKCREMEIEAEEKCKKLKEEADEYYAKVKSKSKRLVKYKYQPIKLEPSDNISVVKRKEENKIKKETNKKKSIVIKSKPKKRIEIVLKRRVLIDKASKVIKGKTKEQGNLVYE